MHSYLCTSYIRMYEAVTCDFPLMYMYIFSCDGLPPYVCTYVYTCSSDGLPPYVCILMQPSPIKLVEKGAEVHQKHNQLVEHRLVLWEAFVTRNKT